MIDSLWLHEPPASVRYWTDFLLLEGTVTVAAALAKVEALRQRCVIVMLSDSELLLLTREQLLRIEPWHRALLMSQPLSEFAARFQEAKVAVIEEDPRYGSLPARCIVVRGGWILGYRDEAEDPHRSLEPSHETNPSATKRACTLRANAPRRVAVQTEFILRVTLSAGERKPPSARELAVIERRPLTLVLSCSAHLSAPAGNVVNLELTAAHGPDAELHAEFRIVAESAGAAQCEILALQNGQFLGALAVTLSVDLQPPAEAGHCQHESVIPPDAIRAALAATQVPAAIEILVRRERLPQATRLRFFVSARDAKFASLALNYREFVSLEIEGDLQAFTTRFLESLEQIALKSKGSGAQARLMLELLCRGHTRRLLPADLLTLLASLSGVADALHIQSDEPTMPWEMLLVDLPSGQARFLCDAFALTRWFPGRDPRPALSLQRVSVIAPDGSAYVSQEKEFLLALPGDSCSVREIPSTWLKVMDSLMMGDQTVIHFTGHGNSPPQSPQDAVIILSDGERLVASQVHGLRECLEKHRPMIVFNGCRTGRLGHVLTGLGGWAESLCFAGAGAFIGTAFTIDDRAALEFTKALYRKLLEGMPLGVAVQQARLQIRTDHDPSWLSYTVFCDPAARCVPSRSGVT